MLIYHSKLNQHGIFYPQNLLYAFSSKGAMLWQITILHIRSMKAAGASRKGRQVLQLILCLPQLNQDMLVGVTLNDNEATHMWKPEASGLFSTRSAYRSFFLSAQSLLNLGIKYGSHGHLGNAKHLCGWLFGIVVGPQIVYRKEVFLILSIALFAIRRRKTFNTSSSHVFLQGNSGMPSCSP